MKMIKHFTHSKGIRYILNICLILVFNGYVGGAGLWAQNPDKVFAWDEGDSGLGFWTKAINCGINSNQPGGGRNAKGSKLTFGVSSHQRFPGVNSVEFWTNSNFEEVCNQNFSAERSEMHANSTYRGLGIREGQTVWFGFSDMYTDIDFNHSATLMQFRNNCGSGSPSTEIVISRARTAPGGERGRLYLVTPRGKSYFGEAIKENVWYDWVIEIKYSKGSDGYFKIWRKEVGSNQTLSYNNPMLVVNGNTMKGGDNCPHFRWGVYRWESADKKPSAIAQEDRMMTKYLSTVKLKIGNNLGESGFNTVVPVPPNGDPPPPPPEDPISTDEDTVCLLTADWSSQDIGTPGVQGKACKKDDTYTVHGGGADIWGTSDNFHFLYKKMKGDVEITARMTSISAENRLTKAGLMIRRNLTPSSEHVLLSLDASATQSFQYRDAAGGSTFNKSQINGAFTTPYWIKLIRRGNTISGYYSLEGVNWEYMDQLAVGMDEEVFVGLVMNSHDDALISKSSFDNVSILGNTSYAPIGPEGEGICFDATAGRLVIEAENYATNIPGVEDAASTQWENRAMTGASGGEAMYAIGSGFNSQDRTPGAKLDYRVSFAKAGTYYIWTRMMGSGPADDSFHAGFNDNPETYGGYGLTTLNHNAWIWVGSVLGNRVRVNIETPGTYVFNVWVREDGVAFDKLIISDDPNYLPIGMGPSESGPCNDPTPDPTDGCDEVANLALLKEARQSSQYGSGAAAIAVDGDTDGSRGPWANGSITHTLQNAQAWWEVDLGDLYEIDQINYFGRTDCCKDRLRDAYVIASPTPFTSNDLQTTLGRSNIRYSFVANYPDSMNTVQMEKFKARYIRIQLRETNYLSLSEVQVFGCTTPVSSQNNSAGTKFSDPTNPVSAPTQDLMTLAPNPSSGHTRLLLSNEYTGTFEAVVHDMLGRMVYRQRFNKKEAQFNYMLLMDGLTEGIYTVTVSNGIYKRTEKLSIRH